MEGGAAAIRRCRLHSTSSATCFKELLDSGIHGAQHVVCLHNCRLTGPQLERIVESIQNDKVGWGGGQGEGLQSWPS